MGSEMCIRDSPLTFLQGKIIPLNDTDITVIPFSTNVDFSRGDQAYAHTSKVAAYPLAPNSLTCFQLRTFLLAKVLTYDSIAQGDAGRGTPALCDTLCEVIRFEWPLRWIHTCLQGIPKRHSSNFVIFVRRFGRTLKKLARLHHPFLLPPFPHLYTTMEDTLLLELYALFPLSIQ